MPPPHMIMNHFLDPTRTWTELGYTIIIVLLCFLVYYKTREIYDLTKYKGIKYFRYAFMFFGLAYASRLFLHMLFIGRVAFDFTLSKHLVMPLSNLLVAYFSTIALLYLTYGVIWKRIKIEHFMIFANIIALVIAVIAFATRSPILISLIQLLLLGITIIISILKHKKGKKALRVRALYMLIFIFWIINMFVLGPRKLLPFEITLILQAISIAVFFLIYYKVSKWTK